MSSIVVVLRVPMLSKMPLQVQTRCVDTTFLLLAAKSKHKSLWVRCRHTQEDSEDTGWQKEEDELVRDNRTTGTSQ